MQQATFTERSPAFTPGLAPCGSRDTSPWYCIVTNPREETRALQHLRNQEFAAYLPLWVPPGRDTRIEPLFPGYLFAQPDTDGCWRTMRSTRGVAAVLLSSDGWPQTVPPQVITALLAQCAPNLVIYPPEPDQLQVNHIARVTHGPMAAFTGICTRATPDRVWLLLEVMRRPIEVGFAREAVEAVAVFI